MLPFLTLTPTPSPPGATPAVLGEPGWGAVWTLSCGNAQSVLEAPVKRWHLHGREKAQRGSQGCRQTGGHGDPWESEASFPAGTNVHTQVSLCTADPDARSGQGSPEPNTVWELRFPGWAGSQRGQRRGSGEAGTGWDVHQSLPEGAASRTRCRTYRHPGPGGGEAAGGPSHRPCQGRSGRHTKGMSCHGAVRPAPAFGRKKQMPSNREQMPLAA